MLGWSAFSQRSSAVVPPSSSTTLQAEEAEQKFGARVRGSSQPLPQFGQDAGSGQLQPMVAEYAFKSQWWKRLVLRRLALEKAYAKGEAALAMSLDEVSGWSSQASPSVSRVVEALAMTASAAKELRGQCSRLDRRIEELEVREGYYIKEIQELRKYYVKETPNQEVIESSVGAGPLPPHPSRPVDHTPPRVEEFDIASQKEGSLGLSTHQSGWLKLEEDGEMQLTLGSVCPSPREQLGSSLAHMPPPDEWVSKVRQMHSEYYEKVESVMPTMSEVGESPGTQATLRGWHKRHAPRQKQLC